MGKINVDYDVLNQKGSPAWYSDLFANIPTPGYTGRMFISTDTFAFYRDNGSGWDLTGGPGIGTITGSGVIGQVSFFSGTQVLSGNSNLFWDNTNNRLGINTNTPTTSLDIHTTGNAAIFNGTGTNNAFLTFANAGVNKWYIGNNYNASANDYQIFDVTNSTARLTIKNTGASTLIGTFTATSLIKSGGTSSQILLADGTTTPTSTFGAGSVTNVSALTLGTSGTDLTSSVANSTTTPVITLNVPTASATNRGALSSADWTTFNNKQATITLTTTGTSGAATLVGATLNIPNYTNVGTVTSVAALTLGTTGTDLSSSVANSTSTPVITLNVPTASATNRGALSSADWTTFNNKQATISVTAPVVLTGATISMPAATTSVNGYLTSTDWNTFNNKSNTNGTVTSVVALTIGTSGIDITSTAVTTTTTPVITLNIPTASASNRGALSSTDWTTFNNKQATLSLTTTGTSGVATLVSNTLNVPNYGSALSGYLPLSGGTLTGALGGTSASFSGNISSTTNTYTLDNTGSKLVLKNTTNTSGFDIGLLGGPADATAYVYNRANASIIFGTNNATVLELNNTGAATFSSTIKSSDTNGLALGSLSSYRRIQYDLASTTFGFLTDTNSTANIELLKGTFTSTGGNGLKVYGAAGTHQWDMYLNSTNIRFSDNTGGGSFVVDNIASFGSTLSASGLITGASGIYQSNASSSIASNTYETYNGGATELRFNFPTSGSVAFNNGTTRFGIASTGAATFYNTTEIFDNTNSGILRLSRDSGNARGQLQFGRNNSGSFQITGMIGLDSDTASVNNGIMYFNTTNSVGTNTERMRITGENVLIGTGTDRNFKLVVEGTDNNNYMGSWNTTTGASIRLQSNSSVNYLVSSNQLGIQVGASVVITTLTTGVTTFTSRGNFLNATDNALFSLNSGGTLYTVGFSPTATASSTNTFTITNGTTTWIYTGSGAATWTLPNPSGNNQIYWIKNAGTGAITLTAFSGTNIINNSAASVSTISIAVGATAVIAQDGNVKSYQLQ